MRPDITCDAIRALATGEVYRRGEAYCRDGAVFDLLLRGPALTASVWGTEGEPYEASVEFAGDEVRAFDCTCPYAGGGACKHVIAALLAYRANPEAVPALPPLDERLAPLDRQALLRLITRRLAHDRDFAQWIETELALPARDEAGAEQLRRRVHALMRARYRDEDGGSAYRSNGDMAQLRDLAARAREQLDQGDGGAALAVLMPVTDALVADWIRYSRAQDDGVGDLCGDLGAMIAEAAFMTESADERAAAAAMVGRWSDQLFEYGDFKIFDFARDSLALPANSPELEAVLRGENQDWPPSDAAVWQHAESVQVLLKVLKARGRMKAFLNLARAAKAGASYGAMLAESGLTAEAVAFAKAELHQPKDMLQVAKALVRAGADDAALDVAEHGLRFVGEEADRWGDAELAQWLRDAASARRCHELAITAAEKAFALTISLKDFRAAKDVAGPRWPELRQRLLEHLKDARYAPDRIAIYLEEGMTDEAVGATGMPQSLSPYDHVLMRLAKAARRSHPDWVIETAERFAEEIIERGSSGQYELAARWLAEAARAFEDDGREEEWQNHIARFIDTHRRRHKLRPMLEALRDGTFG